MFSLMLLVRQKVARSFSVQKACRPSRTKQGQDEVLGEKENKKLIDQALSARAAVEYR